MAEPTDPSIEVWTEEEPAKHKALIEERNLRAEKERHTAIMQMRVLIGVGLVFALTLVTIIGAVWANAVSESFASELSRMILPTALGSGTTIVGALFLSDRGGGKF